MIHLEWNDWYLWMSAIVLSCLRVCSIELSILREVFELHWSIFKPSKQKNSRRTYNDYKRG